MFLRTFCAVAALAFTTSTFAQCGTTSWYGTESCTNPKCLTANGEVFTGADMTAAHWTLPFGTKVRVTDQNTGKSITVRINDRGPHPRLHRMIDLSKVAAEKLGVINKGLIKACIEVL